jgi:CheY-like chemotaxis protein
MIQASNLVMAERGYILVVDDDDDIRTALAEVLRDEGHEVRCAANGREALALLRSSAPPCLVLLDLMMPVMNGWEFREQQLADPALAEIPVFVISAAGNVAEAPVPADQFIPKPIKIDHLLTVVADRCWPWSPTAADGGRRPLLTVAPGRPRGSPAAFRRRQPRNACAMG